jgi:hypothetical protein
VQIERTHRKRGFISSALTALPEDQRNAAASVRWAMARLPLQKN